MMYRSEIVVLCCVHFEPTNFSWVWVAFLLQGALTPPEVLVPVANLVPRTSASVHRVYEWRSIEILAKRRIPDVKSKGEIDTLCLAERPHRKHRREFARMTEWRFAGRLLSMSSGNVSLLIESDLDYWRANGPLRSKVWA
jgi:hypothetical protein